MTAMEPYRSVLRELDAWEPYLLEHSGLPGPRGNIELGQAVADMGSSERFEQLLAWTPERAPTGTAEEFLAFCGTLGLGRLAADGDRSTLPRLRALASDPRWRVREAVAMALQRLGAVDMPALLAVAADWAQGTDLERRAAAAGVCEPVLLRRRDDVVVVLAILDRATDALTAGDRRAPDRRVLRQGLAYAWSVAVAADPEDGRPAMERWLGSADPDVRSVMRQNLAKRRMAAGGAWVREWRDLLVAKG